MQVAQLHSWKKVAAQLILLVLPTSFFFFYFLWDLNRFYAILENQWLKQGLYFSIGIGFTTIFYAFRFRFITTTALLIGVYYALNRVLGNMSVGEFDAFYLSVQFIVFTTIFSLGWIIGYGFSRSKYFTVFWSIFLLTIQIVIVSKTNDISVNTLISAFVPVLAYSLYIIYTAELIRNMNDDEPNFIWFILKRLLGFLLVLLIIFITVFYVFQNDFKAVEKEWGGGKANYDNKKRGNKDSESMNDHNKDGSVSNKDQTKLSGSLNKDKRLVFVAKLDNYFPDGETPNPLYFTSCYYTKFDTLTQTFERDQGMPYNDLFEPNPSSIPMYFVKTDTNVIRNTFATKNRRVVSADIYKVLLSANSYLAPSTAFYCQPIGIQKEYKEQYKNAYRAKMWVSELNSAYFIYNPAGEKALEQFQQQRFEKLRKIKKIKGPDEKFMKYYTFMSSNLEYNKIRNLAKNITSNAQTPIDKMIAIRNYFLSKDEFNQPLFKYSDNPGIPGMPSANKLTYFLFENRKGYCAYYAGATLFMLRSLGIPSRVAAGYLTVNRASKNPGWYWFYENQAHAWVQVYFQEYGWIDFDTTVPDINTQQSEQPDGTPPMSMPQTLLVADGEVLAVDTILKQIKMKVEKLQYLNKEYETDNPEDVLIDVSLAEISSDTGILKLSRIKPQMHITAVSYAEVLKKTVPKKNDDLASILKTIPKPTPIDEVKIMLEEQIKKNKKTNEIVSEPIDWIKTAQLILLVIIGLTVFMFSLPELIWQYFHYKAMKTDRDMAYYRYRASTYYLNQLGYFRGFNGIQLYAHQIDEEFDSNFLTFITVYQKVKYSSISLSENEQRIIQKFYPTFIEQVKKKILFKNRLSQFLNVYNTFYFFQSGLILDKT